MSFVYGGVNSDSLAGVTATLSEWPSLGGHSLETVDKLAGGRFYAGSSQSNSDFVFDVLVQGSTPQEVASRRDNFVGLLDPSRGPRDMVLETDTLWKFPDVLVAEGINWERVGWDRAIGFTLRAEVGFETVGEPHAVQVTPAVHTFTGASSYTLALGNTASFPTVEFPSGAAATVTIGSHVVTVGATPTGFTNVLDYQNFEFFRRNGSGVKVGSLVGLMNNFARPQLQLGVSTSVSVTGAPAGTRRLFPNARRI